MAKSNPQIEAIRNHFESFGRKSITSQWPNADGTGNLVIYWDPVTVKQRSVVMPLAKKDDLSYQAILIIMKACHEDGTKIFTDADKWDLMNKADPDEVQRISDHIFAGIGEEPEQTGKS